MRSFLGDLITSGAASCAVALAGTAKEIVWEKAVGEAREAVPATATTRLDFASLTKPFVATLALVLDASGALPLTTRIGEVWPEADPRLGRRPLADLLRHRSGLAAWQPLDHLCRSCEDVLSLLLGGSLLGTRAGMYSDLDFILWGMAAERVTGTALHELLRDKVLVPLDLSSVEATPGDQPDIAESRMDTGKEALLAARQGLTIPPLPPPPPGQSQDGNARFLLSPLSRGGGVAVAGEGGRGVRAARMTGHAGLFGRARDLWALGAEWLAPGRLLQPPAVAAALGGGGAFALGWWRRSLRNSAGRALSRSSFGHTGFAGGSLWIDPEAHGTGRIFVLLSSRADPFCDMNRWRRRFHTLASRTIELTPLEATTR